MPRRTQHESLEARGGLTGAEARRRLQQQGPNALPEPPPAPAWRLLARQFASPLVGILLVALAIDLAVWLSQAHGVPLEAFAIGAILSGTRCWAIGRRARPSARWRSCVR